MTLSPGYFKARAVDGDFGHAGTGTRQVAVSFEVTDGEAKGAHITWYGFFTQSTGERTLESLRHCGCTFPGDVLTDLTGLGSTEVELVIEEEEGENGAVRPRVRWVNRIGGGVALGSRMTEAEKRQFSAEMRGFVVSSRQVQPGGQAPAQSAAAASNARPATTPTSAPQRVPQRAPAGNGGARRSMNPSDENPPY